MTDLSNEYPNDDKMRAVQLGIEAKYFIEHDRIGRYLWLMSVQHRAYALEQLAVVDPENSKEIRAWQNELALHELFKAWINDAIANGLAAEEQILAEDAAERAGD